MRRWNRVRAWARRRMHAERGSVSLEFLGVGVLLLVPIAYGALTLTQLEQALLGSELAARNAARVLTAEGLDAMPLAEQHIELALANHGLSIEQTRVSIRCQPNPDCSVAGERLTVILEYELPLPLFTAISDLVSIPIESASTFPRQRFITEE